MNQILYLCKWVKDTNLVCKIQKCCCCSMHKHVRAFSFRYNLLCFFFQMKHEKRLAFLWMRAFLCLCVCLAAGCIRLFVAAFFVVIVFICFWIVRFCYLFVCWEKEEQKVQSKMSRKDAWKTNVWKKRKKIGFFYLFTCESVFVPHFWFG